MVGDCNVTLFITSGQQCQRQMVTNLQTTPNTNCSYQYEIEKTCLKNHVANCLSNALASYVKPVTSLLLHQLYHCGDLKYKPSVMNAFFLNLIKCKQQAFMDTEFCWRYFRDRLNANRSDPLLCREYAVAKECVTEKAKANCQICDMLSRDTYNPFCPNNTDPELLVNGCQDLKKPLSCTADTIYKRAMECEKKFLASFLGDRKSNCGTTYTALAECLDKQLSATCQDYANDQRLKDDIQKAVTAVLRGRRFFCEPLSLRAIDLDFKVRPLFPCSAEFLTEMEKCAVPVREEYRSQNITELCGNFQEAVKCSNVAQQTYCKFDDDVGRIIQYPYSLSCEDAGGENQNGGTNVNSSATSVSSGLCLTMFALILQLLQEIH